MRGRVLVARTIHAEPHSFVYQSNFEPPPAHPLLLIILSVCCTPINIILHPPTTRVLGRVVVVYNSTPSSSSWFRCGLEYCGCAAGFAE